jgi:hypothetical protein
LGWETGNGPVGFPGPWGAKGKGKRRDGPAGLKRGRGKGKGFSIFERIQTHSIQI